MTLKIVVNIPSKRGRPSPNAVRPQGRVQPFRNCAEIENTPWSAAAITFAEAVNMSAYIRLEKILAPNVLYVSDWSGKRIRGRQKVLEWFRYRLCRSIAGVLHGNYISSQVIVLPDGQAGVLTAIVRTHAMSLATFKGDGNVASHVYVTTKFKRSELRETLYCPPEG